MDFYWFVKNGVNALPLRQCVSINANYAYSKEWIYATGGARKRKNESGSDE